MPHLHIKGWLLQRIDEVGDHGLWDWQLARLVESHYALSGHYWRGVIRLTLVDLHASGVIESVDEAIDSEGSFGRGRILFRFRLNAFGRQRLLDTGLGGTVRSSSSREEAQ